MDKIIPRELDLCISNQCNMNCRYCYSGHIDRARPQKLNAEILKLGVLQYLRHIAVPRIEKISISGGEPLLEKDMLRQVLPWLRRTAGAGTKMECFTNGLLLDQAAAQMFLDADVHLRVSIDGDAASQDQNRVNAAGASTFARVIRNIRALPVRQRSRLGVCATVTKSTAARLKHNMEFLCSLGVGDVGVSFAVQEAWDGKDLAVLRRELRSTAAWYRKGKAAALRELPLFGYKRLRTGKAGLDDLRSQGEVSMGPDGVFYPCSIISASGVAQDAALKPRYAAGDWVRGLDAEKIRRSRERACREIRACGESEYLSCLLCIYYKDLIAPAGLKMLLKSSADIVKVLLEEGMGELIRGDARA